VALSKPAKHTSAASASGIRNPGATMTQASPKGEAAAAGRWLSPPLNVAGKPAPSEPERIASVRSPPSCWATVRWKAFCSPTNYPPAAGSDASSGHNLRANHSAGEFVRTGPHAAAKAHSTTAESRNAPFKREIAGVWHWLLIKHLDRYCTETAFRWNHRDHATRLSALLGGNAGRLPWKALLA
jgi:hypothetical protein